MAAQQSNRLRLRRSHAGGSAEIVLAESFAVAAQASFIVVTLLVLELRDAAEKAERKGRAMDWERAIAYAFELAAHTSSGNALT